MKKKHMRYILVGLLLFTSSCAQVIFDKEEFSEKLRPDGSWETKRTVYWKPATNPHEPSSVETTHGTYNSMPPR